MIYSEEKTKKKRSKVRGRSSLSREIEFLAVAQKFSLFWREQKKKRRQETKI